MKFSKTAVLTLSCVFSVAGFWLLAVSASNRNISFELSNMLQHMQKVILITTGDDTRATITNIGGDLVGLETNNFILTQTWENENKILQSSGSSILWWIKNEITNWEYDVVLAWSWNKIYNSKFSAILWWESNELSDSDSSEILGWKGNNLKWVASVIPWWLNNTISGDYSVVVWNNSHVTWNNSIALWSGSNVNANNSFLWTDWEHWDEILSVDNVFSVISRSGMVINTGTANRMAKLTIRWPIIVSESVNDDSIVCGGGNWWWILKVKRNDNKICLCSCNWSGWNSMFGNQWNCTSVCKDPITPLCGNSVSKFCDSNIKNQYSWSCDVWNVVEWTWAYLMDKNDILHWSCQTDDGQSVSCTWIVNVNNGCS